MTKRAATRPAARDEGALLRAILGSPAIGIVVTEPDLSWVEVNDQACAMLGYTRAELLQKTWMEVTHPDDLPRDIAQVGRLMAGDIDGFAHDKRFIRKDGSILWASVSVNCVRGPRRKVRHFVTILKDIGKRKQVENELRRSEARLVRVQDGSSDGFGDFDATTGLVSITPRYAEIYGLPPGTRDVPVEALFALVDHRDLPAIQADMAAIRAGEKDAHVWEFRIRRPDGSTRWVQSRGRVLGRDGSGVPVHVSGSTTDVTERKRIEEERERLVQELRAAIEHVKTLSGIVPICSGCKKIRDDEGYWEQVEAYVSRHTVARFSHGICPDCARRLFPED